MVEIIDWDAFEKWEKKGPGWAIIPPGLVGVSKSGINLGSFAEKFPTAAVLRHQEGFLLLTPTENLSLGYRIRKRSVACAMPVRVIGIELGTYPARWVTDKGLLIDLRSDAKRSLEELLA